MLESLCGVSEYGGAKISPAAVVFDMGANLGTFTRGGLDRGAAKVVALVA